MNNEILFSERQQLKQLWIVLLIVIAFLLNYFLHKQYGDEIYFHHLFKMWVPTYCLTLIALFFKYIRLDTEIRTDGIYYQFFPFQLKMKKITWDEIEKIYVRQYNPIMEYGGWGTRIGLFGKGWALNIAGNNGIQIIFKDSTKRKLLIGTQKTEEVKEVLNKLMK